MTPKARKALRRRKPGRIPKFVTKLMQAELDFLRSLL